MRRQQRQAASEPAPDESYQDFMARCVEATGNAMACQDAWDTRVNRRAMPGLVFKKNESAAVPKTDDAKPWWQWTEEHVTCELEALREAVGQVIGMKACEVRGDLMREIGFLKRELAILREEVAAASKLKALREEVEAAQATIPRVPDLVADLKAQQTEMRKETARLRRELAASQDRIATLNVENSQVRYTLSEMEKQLRPTSIDAATLERWRQSIERWLKEHAEPAEPPQLLLLPTGHTLPLERGNGAPPSN